LKAHFVWDMAVTMGLASSALFELRNDLDPR
jgi:hypothetical protein